MLYDRSRRDLWLWAGAYSDSGRALFARGEAFQASFELLEPYYLNP